MSKGHLTRSSQKLCQNTEWKCHHIIRKNKQTDIQLRMVPYMPYKHIQVLPILVSRPAVIVVVYHNCMRGITYNNVWYNLFRTEYRNIETLIFPIKVVCGTLRHDLLSVSNTTMNSSTKHSNSTNTHSDNKIADKYCLDNFSPSENDTKPVVKQDANNVLQDPQCCHGAAAVEGKKKLFRRSWKELPTRTLFPFGTSYSYNSWTVVHSASMESHVQPRTCTVHASQTMLLQHTQREIVP